MVGKQHVSIERRGFLRLAGFAAFGIAVVSSGLPVVADGPAQPPRRLDPESARVELGRRLFFDPAASRTGMRSCADCHDPEHGYSDETALSRDARGPTPRRTQSLVDCADSPTMDWLGAFRRIEDVVGARSETGPATPKPPYYGGVPTPLDPSIQFVSRDLPDAEIPLPHEVLCASGRYGSAFEAAYASATPTAEHVVKAISAYCRSIRSGESPYDRYVAGDKAALSDAAKRGLELFRGKAACTSCHPMDGKRATFSDYKFHETGLPGSKAEAAVAAAVSALVGGTGTITATGRVAGVPVPGLLGVTRPRAGFKTPTLRDVARRGPFMHDGSLATLEDVVRFFLSGRPGPDTDEMMPTYAANDDEVRDLVEFLGSLSSAARPGAPHVAWSLRTRKTEIHLVDANHHALAHWPLTLVAAGDALPGAPTVSEPLHLVTNGDGWASFTPPLSTHVRLVLEGGLQPEGGCWIPDTCTSTRITLPICGTGHVRVTLPADAPVPDTMELVHDGAKFFPDRKAARSLLHKEAVVESRGENVVVYAAVVRTDVEPVSALWLPPGLTSDGKPMERLTLHPGGTIDLHLRRR